MTNPALVVDEVSVAFGDVQALRDVGFSLAAGTITGLIGPNGAGKTTLLDVVSGFLPPRSGHVVIDGQALSSAPHQRARSGLGRTFQTIELFDDMSVAENLQVAAETAGTSVESADEAARVVGLDAADPRLAADLAHGDRKRLALARALVATPSVLLLDEPAAGLDPHERDQLGDIVRGVAAAGTAVLLVDHDLGFVLDICDRVVVLDFGAVIANGTPAEITTDPAVTAAYVGSAMTRTAERETSPRGPAPVSGAALSVRNLSAGYGGTDVVTDVDLDVDAGEIVSLLGPNGAGKTTTLMAVSGALQHWKGTVEVFGRPLRPGRRLQGQPGVAHVLQHNRVVSGLTAAENLRLASRSRAAIDGVLDLMPALKPLLRKQAGRLSGGEQQMLAVARALATLPRLLIVDELSLGLAPNIVADLLGTLATLARQSATSILLAEQHTDLALDVADRAYVLVAGRIVLSAPASELAADPARLAAAYLGEV